MAFVALMVLFVAIAVLAPLYGTDSRWPELLRAYRHEHDVHRGVSRTI